MAQLKRIIIKSGDLNFEVMSTTEVKVSEEIDSDLVKTFDDPVPVPSSDGGYTVSIETLETRQADKFIALKKAIKQMKTKEGEISVYETHERKEGNIDQELHFGGCLLSSNEVTFNAEDLTARSLEFKVKTLRELVNGTEI
jgi:hypothetical protein